MEALWRIIGKWDEFAQFLFFIIMGCVIIGAILRVIYYIAVAIRGWPPEYESDFYDEEDTEEV